MSGIILDTNVFVAAGFNPASAAARLIRAVREGRLRLVWNEPTRNETETILRRIPKLRWADVEDLFRPETEYAGVTDIGAFSGIPDPDDRKFAALGAATRCPLITNDNHLLAHGNTLGIDVLTPRAFIERKGASGSGQGGAPNRNSTIERETDMSQDRPEVLTRSVQETDIWLKELKDELRLENPNQAYGALRAVLHALRDRLTVDMAAHLAAQLPAMITGIYYDGWKPAAVPNAIRTRSEFIQNVRDRASGHDELDPGFAIQGVVHLLERKIEPGQIRKILSQLPEELRGFWSERFRG